MLRGLNSQARKEQDSAAENLDHAFRESEARFLALFDGLGEGIIFCDRSDKIVLVNKEMARLTGFSQDEMVGKHAQGLFIAPSEFAYYQERTQTRLQGIAERYEIQLTRKDGSLFWAQINGTPFLNSDGQIVGTLGVVTDITEQKHNVEAMSHQRELLRWVIDTNPGFIFVKDHEGRFVLVNKAFADFYGTTPDRMIGLRNLDVHPYKDEVPQFLKEDQQVLRTNEPLLIPERAFRHPLTGKIIWGQTIKVPIQFPQIADRFVLGVITDISKRKEAEKESKKLHKQLTHAQKMEAVGQLAAGVAHDLNNALGAVVGHLQLLHDLPNLEAGPQHSVTMALYGCERATTLLQQLLRFARPGKLNLKTVSLPSIISQTVDFVGRIIGKDIRIVIEGHAQELYVAVDETQIQQVLTNLIINASHAMPAGGTITFATRTEEVLVPELFNSRARAGVFVVLSVSDTGNGIKPEHLDKIFEPFFTTKAEGKGTGLGLSIVYNTLQHLGGWVDVESVLGRGTTFSLFLPLATPQEKTAVQSNLNPPQLTTQGTVLVVDDEPVLVDLAHTFLQRAGIQTKGFTNPVEAVDWYRSHWEEIDLIIIDMKMPGMNGDVIFDLLRTINTNAQIILLSGFTSDQTTSELLNRGAVKFLQKPLSYPDLVEFISKQLKKKTLQSTTN